jgi:hypothetical protein
MAKLDPFEAQVEDLLDHRGAVRMALGVPAGRTGKHGAGEWIGGLLEYWITGVLDYWRRRCAWNNNPPIH